MKISHTPTKTLRRFTWAGMLALALAGSPIALAQENKKDSPPPKSSNSQKPQQTETHKSPPPVRSGGSGAAGSGSTGNGGANSGAGKGNGGSSGAGAGSGGTVRSNRSENNSSNSSGAAGRSNQNNNSGQSNSGAAAGGSGEGGVMRAHKPRDTAGAGATGSATGGSGKTNTGEAGRSKGSHDTGNTGGTPNTNPSVNTDSSNTDDQRRGRGARDERSRTTGNAGNANSSGSGNHKINGTSGTGGNATGAAGASKGLRIDPETHGVIRGANGKPERFRGRDGSEARFGRDGNVREVRARGLTIIHTPGGSRHVVLVRPDHSRIFVNRAGHGYVQRPFFFRGREFASRTYYYHGRPYALYYRPYAYRGVYYYGYVPYRYYRPGFYGWLYNPWRTPVRYNWGWFGSPWYGYYGSYFTPYSYYPSASFWLADYLIAESLQLAYQERLDAQASYYGPPGPRDSAALTPEVKQAIADEVQRQLALENNESQLVSRGEDPNSDSGGLPRMLAAASPSKPVVFVVAGSIQVTDNNGADCSLTQGDVIRLTSPPGEDATSAYVEVLASKNSSCPRGSRVSVELADLQEMQNQMRAGIDQGLQELNSHQGGLPAPPPSAAGAPITSPYAPVAPPADPNVSATLQQQAREADSVEKSVMDEVKQADSTGGAEPAQISLGQTTEEVVAIMGKPKQVVNLGSKRIYVYQNLKVTFTDGRVSDVQ
ncbi:MAG: hypothetical protein DMF61_12735 [Blastocatellia bacterium AA13]|nr:MAG: hypothetical protein DMF61_12735 [Blastocatellia bacterium AA13]